MVVETLAPKQPMTLIVLKLVIQTFDQDLRAETVKATLQFKDVDRQRADDLEVQAWAPFHILRIGTLKACKWSLGQTVTFLLKYGIRADIL